jgi:pimeloyl-ACP methyl ester carboxylesterase
VKRAPDAVRTRQLVDDQVAVWSDEGQGPAVVLVHGLPGSGGHFRHITPLLTHELRVIRVDLPGFGEAPMGAAPVTVTGLAAHVAAVLRWLELPRAVVVGHSFGTSVALATAQAAPEIVAGVGLVAPVGLEPHRGFKRVPRPRLWSQVAHARGLSRLTLPMFRQLFVRTGFGAVSDRDIQRTFAVMAAFDFDMVRTLAEATTCPVYGAWSVDDPLIEAHISQALLDVLPAGPRQRFDTGGHGLQKTQAVAIAGALVPWVRGLIP